jgi:hypothetical protein
MGAAALSAIGLALAVMGCCLSPRSTDDGSPEARARPPQAPAVLNDLPSHSGGDAPRSTIS